MLIPNFHPFELCLCHKYRYQSLISIDPYVQNFVTENIEDYSLDSGYELSQILIVNKNNSNFKILHCNIRSLNKNIDEYKVFLSSLESEIDCIVFTETRIIDSLNIYSITGYNSVLVIYPRTFLRLLFIIYLKDITMDSFIRDVNFSKIDTVEIENAVELNQIMSDQEHKTMFKILHQNIRSISKNIDEMDVYLSQINTDFECIVFTETFQINDLGLFCRNGYGLIYNNGGINKNDGVVVFLKNNLEYKSNIVSLDVWNIIEIEIKISKNENVLITAVYRPPSTSLDSFVQNWSGYLEKIKNYEFKHHILIGDFNIDILVEDQEISSNYLNVLSEYNYVSMINKATRVQNNSSSCLDHIFLNTKSECVREESLPIIIKSGITDHFSTVLVMVMKIIEKKQSLTYKKYINYHKLKSELRETNWSIVYRETSIEKAMTTFTEKLTGTIEKHTQKIKIKRKSIKRKIWITDGLVKSINTKEELYKKYIINPTVYKKEYVTYKNQLNRLIETTKKNYYVRNIENSKKNTKALWNTVKTLHNPPQKQEITKIESKDHKLVEDEQEMTEIFNNYFISVGKTLADNITPSVESKPEGEPVSHSFFLVPTTKQEIKTIIDTLKNGKTPGYDSVTAEMLKEISEEISTPLEYLINNIFSTGICPSHFKMSIVKPLFKKGEKTKPENYRPVSLITNITKIFEKIIKVRMTQYLDKYRMISEKQYGFRQGISTQDAIANITSKIYECMEDGLMTIGIFLDLSKAFDTVNHGLLLEALEELGFRGTVLKLFSNYLTNRKQSVQIKNKISSQQTITCGVPQGTVLGPILFSIYINKLLTLKCGGEIFSFADDTVVLYKDDSWSNLKNKIELGFGNVLKWFDQKYLTVNYDKTKFMPFTIYKNNLPQYETISIQRNDTVELIHSTVSMKYLGVTLDRHLRWDIHAQNIVNTLRYMLPKFKYLIKVLNTHHMKILYHALIESRLQYGILGWGGVADIHLKKIEILQKRFLKIIFKRPYRYPTDELYREAKCFDLKQSFFYCILVNLYRNKHELKTIEHKYTTRQKSNLDIRTKYSKKAIGQRCFTYLAPRLFNFLHRNMKDLIIHTNSITLLRNKLKSYTLNLDRKVIHDIL